MRQPVIESVVVAIIAMLVITGPAHAATKQVHPVVIVSLSSILIGGSANGKWLSAKQIASLASGKLKYRLYSNTSYLGQAIGNEPRRSERNPRYLIVDLSPFPQSALIAISGNWNAIPRKAKNDRTDRQSYQNIVRMVLAKKGLAKSPVNITKAINVDLEGDEQNETIICATSRDFEPWLYQKGQYSLVLLHKAVKGKTKTILLSGKFHTKSPSSSNVNGIPNEYPEHYDLGSVWDIDGDGVLEIFILVFCERADCVGSNIYKIIKEKPVLLFEGGIGA